MSRRSTLGLLTSLYVSQFLGLGFLFTALTGILRERGASLEQLGAVYLFTLAWVVKVAWAPLVDRFGSRRHGHYRSWLLVLQPAIALGLLALTPLDVIEDLGLVLLVLAVVVLLSATQDIAADALAVRLLRGQVRGTANGIQIAAGFVGDAIGGGLVLVLYDRFGWATAVGALAALTVLPTVQLLAFRENTGEPSDVGGTARPRPTLHRPTVAGFLRQPGALRWTLVLIPLTVLGTAGVYAMLTPMLIDAGWSLTRLGLVTNVVGGLAAIVGAIAGGIGVHLLGARRALIGYGVGQVVALTSVLPVAYRTGGLASVVVAVVLLNLANSAIWAAVYAVCMDRARPWAAGTDFTAQVGVLYLVRIVGASVIVGAAGSAGYPPMVMACMGFAIVGTLAAARYFTAPAPAPVPDDVVRAGVPQSV